MTRYAPFEDRFNEAYCPEPNSGCWLWMKTGTQYGQIYKDGTKKYAHRAAYEFFVGEIPEDKHVLHVCDVPCCVNPDHLFLGTHKENMDDRDKKKRQPIGERQGGSKLTEEKVIKIRLDNRPHEKIADDYGVARGTIGKIKRREKWAHVK